MSTENVQKFAAAAAADPELAARVQEIHSEAAREVAAQISGLASEAGMPFTVEEFLANVPLPTDEISEEQLESVAGGTWKVSDGNILFSLMTLGVGCGFVASASVMITGKRDADDCQPANWGK